MSYDVVYRVVWLAILRDLESTKRTADSVWGRNVHAFVKK